MAILCRSDDIFSRYFPFFSLLESNFPRSFLIWIFRPEIVPEFGGKSESFSGISRFPGLVGVNYFALDRSGLVFGELEIVLRNVLVFTGTFGV